ncbi:MAG: DNA adenine methylase [Kofleriaceae bacterium]
MSHHAASTIDFLAAPSITAEPPGLAHGLVAPFPYFGGKRRAAALVWERFGDVTNYCEPFAGSLAVLLARPTHHRARVETVNDMDGLIVNVWRAIAADPEAVARGCDWPVLELDLHARHRALIAARADLAKKLDADPRWHDPELAAWWVWGASCWIGAGWCDDHHRNARGRQRPALSGGQESPKAGTGVHAGTQREPTRKLPILIGGNSGPSPQYGKGVRASTQRETSPVPERRQLPAIGGSFTASRDDAAYANYGKGVHSATVRTALYDTFERLAARLRYVRVTCGDWARICTPAVTWKHGLTGVLLDPPYSDPARTAKLYARDSMTVATDVRAWALNAGQREDMRIALCGYEGEHDELLSAGWSVVAWKAHGGYGVQADGAGRENAARERIWFSPHCLSGHEDAPRQRALFSGF